MLIPITIHFASFVPFPVNNTFESSCSTVITFDNHAQRLGWAIRGVKATEDYKGNQ